MDTEKEIKKGRITEKELVRLFGSETLKKSYERNGHFVGANKKTLLSCAARYCSVKNLGPRQYEITDVYKYPIPLNFNRMKSSFYKYIIPLILRELIDTESHSKTLSMTAMRLAGKIGIVNRNYNLVRYNKLELSDYLAVQASLIDDFYRRTERMISEYIIKSLNYLSSAGIIVWEEVYWVYKESLNSSTLSKDDEIEIEVSRGRHLASSEEIKFYYDCIAVADRVAHIKDNKERYYSSKSRKFREVLKRELYKDKIRRVYKSLEIRCLDFDKCKFLLDCFSIGDIDCFVGDFNTAITKKLIKQARNRYNQHPNKYMVYGSNKDYVSFFCGMCNITISKDMEPLNKILRTKTISNSYEVRFTHKSIGECE